jgi:hypothetical protein
MTARVVSIRARWLLASPSVTGCCAPAEGPPFRDRGAAPGHHTVGDTESQSVTQSHSRSHRVTVGDTKSAGFIKKLRWFRSVIR